MTFNIIATPRFNRRIKKLAKKYASLKEEYLGLVENLEIQPKQGMSIGGNCFKIRLLIKSKGKGKSGGARVITYVALIEETVYLLAIYDKSDVATISQDELDKLLKEIK